MIKQTTPISVEAEQKLKEELAQAVGAFRKPTDILAFLTLFLSEAELLIVAKRLAIFKRLIQGKSYEDIQRELGVSSATVSAVAQLKNDPFANTVTEHIQAQDWAEDTAVKLRNIFKRS